MAEHPGRESDPDIPFISALSSFSQSFIADRKFVRPFCPSEKSLPELCKCPACEGEARPSHGDKNGKVLSSLDRLFVRGTWGEDDEELMNVIM